MDIKIKSDEGNFKYRANAVIIKDNKVLLVKMNKSEFFCCMGGHIHLLEDSMNAVEREAKEETGFDVKVEKLLMIVENFFTNADGKNMHELGYFYQVQPINIPEEKQKDFKLVENDEGKLVEMDFRWFDLDKLNDVNIKPDFLKEKLSKINMEFEHIIFKKDLKLKK